MTTRTAVPAVAGWFTLDPAAPALLGSRCATCGTYAFPKLTTYCPNPRCAGDVFDEVELSRRGRVWSWTVARYQPPPPYVAPADPFEPFAIAAVELPEEGLVVMGQVAGGEVDGLRVGLPVELVLDVLHSDDQHDYLVWKWRPLEASNGE